MVWRRWEVSKRGLCLLRTMRRDTYRGIETNHRYLTQISLISMAHGRRIIIDHCLSTEQADDWPLPNYRVIKVLMNFWDVAADGGATAVVPASVRPLYLSRCSVYTSQLE